MCCLVEVEKKKFENLCIYLEITLWLRQCNLPSPVHRRLVRNTLAVDLLALTDDSRLCNVCTAVLLWRLRILPLQMAVDSKYYLLKPLKFAQVMLTVESALRQFTQASRGRKNSSTATGVFVVGVASVTVPKFFCPPRTKAALNIHRRQPYTNGDYIHYVGHPIRKRVLKTWWLYVDVWYVLQNIVRELFQEQLTSSEHK